MFFPCGGTEGNNKAATFTGELYAAFLNVHHARGRVTLGVDLLRFSIFHDSSRHTGRIEKSLRMENGHLYIFEFFDHRSQMRPQIQCNCEGGFLSAGYRTLPVGYFSPIS